VALRLAWGFLLAPMPVSDYAYYLDEIRRILATGAYPFESNYPVAMVYYAAVLGVSGSQAGVWVANALLGGLQAACLGVAAGNLLEDRRAGVVAALLWAAYPAMVTFAPVMTSESPAISLILLILALMTSVQRLQGRIWLKVGAAAVLGVLMGLAFYCRNTTIVFLPALALVVLLDARSDFFLKTAQTLLFFVGLGLVFLPQAAWHQARFGTPEFRTNPQEGLVFLYGTSRETNGRWNKEWQNRMIAEVAADGFVWPDYAAKKEASRRVRPMALANIKADPAGFLFFALTDKFDQMWANDNVLASSWEGSAHAKARLERFYNPLSMVLNASYVSLWILALAGGALGLARLATGQGVAHLVILTFFGFHLLFEVQPRYHLPAMPFVCLLAACGLSWLAGGDRARQMAVLEREA